MNYSDLWKKLKPYAVADIRAIGTSGGTNTSTGGVATMAAHEIADTSGLGAYHTVSGLTSGQVLKATGATTAAFGNLTHSQLTGVGANDHHNQVHSITGADHSITASQYQVVGATGTNTLGLLTPSADVSGGGTSILRSNAGALELLSLTTPTLQSDATLTITPGTYAILSDDKSLRTSTYTSGFTGSGATYSTASGATLLEVDNAIVRGRLRVYELLIAQIRATNGSVLIANAGKANAVSGSGPYTVTIEPYMVFANGDIIRAQRFTGSGTYVCMGTVSGVSGLDFTLTLSVGSDAPTVGMEFVRLGSTSDASRRGSIYLTADETYAPYMDVLGGIDDASDWGTAGVVKVRLGRLDGITSGTNEYGLWAAGANTGDHLLISATSGFELVAANGAVSIDDSDGITLSSSTSYSSSRQIDFSNPSGVFASLAARYSTSPAINYTRLTGDTTGSRRPFLSLESYGTGALPGAVSMTVFIDGAGTTSVAMDETGVLITGNTGITGTLDVSSTLTVATINKSTGVNLQYNGNTKLATVTGGVEVTGYMVATSDVQTSGTLRAYGSTPYFRMGNDGVSTGSVIVDMGLGRTGSGASYINLIGDTTYTDYGLRLLRNGGNTGNSEILHRGTGILYLNGVDAADVKIKTNNTNRLVITSTGETKAESGLYVNGDAGGIAGYVGFTDTTSGVSSGTGKIMMNSTSSNVESDGWLTIYIGTTTAYIPYWTSHT